MDKNCDRSNGFLLKQYKDAASVNAAHSCITRRAFGGYAASKMALTGFVGTGILSFDDIANAAPRAASIRQRKGISYGANKLDIYWPSAESMTANAPIVAYVHGGAWRGGSRRSVGSKAEHFTRRGNIFISIGYTLFPRADAEAQAVQVAQAFHWIRQNAGIMGGDAEKICMMGHSAGCHLTALAVLSGAASPRAVIFNDTGAYDLGFLAELYGGRLPTLYSALNRRAKWHRWSPISYVANREQPPALVMWSGGRYRDRISQRFADALSDHGPVAQFDGRRYNHVSINSAIGRASNPATSAIDSFVYQHMK